MNKKLLAVPAIAGVVIVVLATAVMAWLPVKLFVQVNPGACPSQSATITAENPEHEPATVQDGNVWAKGTIIPIGHYDAQHNWIPGRLGKDVSHSGTYTVTVNYPSDHTLRSASISVDIPKCPVETCPPGTHQTGVTQSRPAHPICEPNESTTTTTEVKVCPEDQRPIGTNQDGSLDCVHDEGSTTTTVNTDMDISTAESVTAATAVETTAAFTG